MNQKLSAEEIDKDLHEPRHKPVRRLVDKLAPVAGVALGGAMAVGSALGNMKTVNRLKTID